MADIVSNAAEVTNKAVFLTAGTDENVQGAAVEVSAEVGCVIGGPDSPPRRRCGREARDTERMKLSRPVSWFLLAFGVWSWFIWITFHKQLTIKTSEPGEGTGHSA
ncbi:hypothetical protein AB0I94_35565 [Streptomyces sp. NPDC050147]|uniref:hypothetical protein n=1 Tax=Streptomyces sp. NPDC050147 TaxID=3155513 RepID=UPI00342D656A